MKKICTIILKGFLILICAGLVAGVLYEQFSRWRAPKDFPPQGKMITISDGREIQLDCRGKGRFTVVFESGLDHFGSLSWAGIHNEVAQFARACAYSRSGVMWSSPRNTPASLEAINSDLHETLKNAGEKGPFILVGHSIGGVYNLAYTKKYGGEVAGLVFVDSSHPEQDRRLQEATPKYRTVEITSFSEALGAFLRFTGVSRLSLLLTGVLAPNQPEETIQPTRALGPTATGPTEETKMLQENFRALDKTYRLKSRPVYVLTGMAPSPEFLLKISGLTLEDDLKLRNTKKQLHSEIAHWSKINRHEVLPDAHHYIHYDSPGKVAAAIQWVVKTAR